MGLGLGATAPDLVFGVSSSYLFWVWTPHHFRLGLKLHVDGCTLTKDDALCSKTLGLLSGECGLIFPEDGTISDIVVRILLVGYDDPLAEGGTVMGILLGEGDGGTLPVDGTGGECGSCCCSSTRPIQCR